jgi:hypothetical protein
MANALRSVLAATAFIAAGLAHSNASAQSNPNASAQSNLRERIGAAIEMIEGACASDVRNFCGNVTRGEGRLMLCMQAYDDQLSAVTITADKFEQLVDKVRLRLRGDEVQSMPDETQKPAGK